MLRRLNVVTTELGPGYAVPTPFSESALTFAAERGLALEPVYTAKAFAHVLALDRSGHDGLAYWHTAAAAPRAPYPADALPPALQRLFRRDSS